MDSIHACATDSIIDESQIQPFYHLSFERSLSHASRGLCLVEISLKNNGFIAASFPFLCLTNLGLNLLPAPGWAKDESVMVRKMLRFSPSHVSDSTLEAGAVVKCCTVALRYKFSFGGCLEFEAGSEHLLSNFPNLNLTCAVGAGNYPSKRILLQVPATALRNVIKEQVGLANNPCPDRTTSVQNEPAAG